MISRYQVNYQLRTHKRDQLIEFIKTLLLTPFVLQPSQRTEKLCEIFEHLEQLIEEHMSLDQQQEHCTSRLHTFVPSLGAFFTPLPLKQAFLFQDQKCNMSNRSFIPPSFNDIRRILNTAQLMALKGKLKMITFDADMTLYADGGTLEEASPLIPLLIQLLKNDLIVAIVTAAGYPTAERYQQRLQGLLNSMTNLPKHQAERLFVMGGECNYFMQSQYPNRTLSHEICVPDQLKPFGLGDLKEFLDKAGKALESCIQVMHLKAEIIHKERAVGLVPLPNHALMREQLDECVLSVQQQLQRQYQLQPFPPYCVFNGGSDVWVDLGNKQLGVRVLQQRLNCLPNETLHVGDQFLSTGNDIATRRGCCTVWVVNPKETEIILQEYFSLLKE